MNTRLQKLLPPHKNTLLLRQETLLEGSVTVTATGNLSIQSNYSHLLAFSMNTASQINGSAIYFLFTKITP